MRIIAGKFKGRTIDMPKGIRPTSDKVREALFEILKNKIVGARFLDLYCGSGAVGIEAFSRGANSIALVDNNLRCTVARLAQVMSKIVAWNREYGAKNQQQLIDEINEGLEFINTNLEKEYQNARKTKTEQK